MVLAVRDNVRQRAKVVHNSVVRLGTGKALKQFLQHNAGCEDGPSRIERLCQRQYFRAVGWGIEPQRKRPHTSVDEEIQERDRSCL